MPQTANDAAAPIVRGGQGRTDVEVMEDSAVCAVAAFAVLVLALIGAAL